MKPVTKARPVFGYSYELNQIYAGKIPVDEVHQVEDVTAEAVHFAGIYLARNKLSMKFLYDGRYYEISVSETDPPKNADDMDGDW